VLSGGRAKAQVDQQGFCPVPNVLVSGVIKTQQQGFPRVTGHESVDDGTPQRLAHAYVVRAPVGGGDRGPARTPAFEQHCRRRRGDGGIPIIVATNAQLGKR